MSNPLVSVMMLAYNHAPYVVRAIESVLGQRVDFDIELVIGEDCSTDGTREIVFEYAKRFPTSIRVVTSDSNVGMHQNGFRTSQLLRGKYVAWCEGDDYWHREDKLQMQVRYLEAHPEYGLVCSDYDRNYVTQGYVERSYMESANGRYVQKPSLEDILTGRGGILTCTAVARRELVQEVESADLYLHRDGPFLMGDTQLWAEISRRALVYRFPESLATHNLLDESATRSADIRKVLKFWISNSEMCLYLCKKYDISQEIRDSHIATIRRKTLQLAVLTNDKGLADSMRKQYPQMNAKDMIWYFATRVWMIRFLMLHTMPSFHGSTWKNRACDRSRSVTAPPSCGSSVGYRTAQVARPNVGSEK